MTDPCANTDQCHHWPRHDDRCDRTTQPHSAICSRHQDRDYLGWWDGHDEADCCDRCCRGEIDHD